jgi:hypothetical protein
LSNRDSRSGGIFTVIDSPEMDNVGSKNWHIEAIFNALLGKIGVQVHIEIFSYEGRFA